MAGQLMLILALPPGQYDPALHTAHGLVPTTEPLPKYPGWHRHAF